MPPCSLACASGFAFDAWSYADRYWQADRQRSGLDSKIYGLPNNASDILIIDHAMGTACKFQLAHHRRIELFDSDGKAVANFTFASDDKAKRAAKALELVMGEAFCVTRAE